MNRRASRCRSLRHNAFTLVEVMVAVTVSAVLILGVSLATQATVRTAERQKSEARREEQRARAAELLRQDWRGRIRFEKAETSLGESTQGFVLSTTADPVLPPGGRASRAVGYRASKAGLVRLEGGTETLILPGPVSLEFWDGKAWKADAAGAVEAVRVCLTEPAEALVLR